MTGSGPGVPAFDLLAALPARDLRTAVGHSAHHRMSPLSEASLREVIDRLRAADRLLHVGCGEGDLRPPPPFRRSGYGRTALGFKTVVAHLLQRPASTKE